jgi:hypothetical protein
LAVSDTRCTLYQGNGFTVEAVTPGGSQTAAFSRVMQAQIENKRFRIACDWEVRPWKTLLRAAYFNLLVDGVCEA